MYSSGMVGVAGGIFAVQFAPHVDLLESVPSWALGLLIVLAIYLFTFWRSAAASTRRT